MPSEAGYDELRRLFDYLLAQGIIGPARAGESAPLDEALNGSGSETSSISGELRRACITVIDADDLLQNPEAILKVYCKEVGIDYTPRMLEWGDDENQEYAAKAFEKWYGFHHDAIESTCLRPRAHGHVSVDLIQLLSVLRGRLTDNLFSFLQKVPTVEQENEEWRKKFGDEAAKVIRETVDANTADYEYLKSFAIKV